MDVDRRYFNDRGGDFGYATINLFPGYQKLGGYQALDFVRFRHTDSDFFRAGGSSLTAVKLIARAEETFGEDSLPPEDLFDKSGIREIAESIVRNRQQVDAPQA